VRVSGAVRRVRASGRGGLPMLRAELGGGTDRITVIWLGRNHIAGIEPGRMLAVEGMLSEQGGRRIMYNPRYDLAADQAAGPAPRP
jgi:hypothetical protein